MPISLHPNRWLRGTLILWLGLVAGHSWLRAAELEKAQALFRKGEYLDCLKLVEEVTKTDRGSEEWRILQLQILLTVGRYDDALQAATNAVRRNSSSIRVRLAAWDALRQNGRREEAEENLEEIKSLSNSRFSVRDAPSLVALGRAALTMGNDPKVVLENCYERARKSDPACRDAYLAAGDLALLKHDDALASKNFQEGLAKFEDDPDMLFGLAQAFAEGERGKMLKYLQAALEANPNHLPSRLLLVEHLIDGERYEDAERELQKVLKVNPDHPEGWAYRSVLAHLTNLPDLEKQARVEALKHWKDNPLVDHLIGKKLSQKYRFAEGAEHQRQALKFDVAYLPAKAQLAVDLLRLGKEEDGWKMVQEVYEKDAYDVNAFNLVTLQDNMAKFVTLTNEHFMVRMIAREAQLYGQRVLALLERAKTTLCPKYGWEFEGPVIVEIFPEQKDFGVRTFGMPDNPGYLGVCFGPVITANSPASQAANPSSWEAVLYHEFCHVVTLHITRNKMPRWLSEGISVFEETQANAAWGQPMTPQYREKILDKGLKPVGELSAAFLTAKSGLDLQFAYYQSSLAVEFLVGRYGLESLKNILRTLGEGEAINAAIAKHTAPLPQIEKEFAAYAKEKAEKLAPGLDWEKPPAADPLQAPPDWLARHANNYYLLTAYAKKLLTDKKWEEAKTPLHKLLELYPANVGGDNAYILLARAHRGLNDTNAERAVLTDYVKRSADSTAGFERLMELATVAKDWPVVAENVARYLAVNPLTPAPYRYHALASEALGKPEAAIDAYRTQLLLDPPNPAEVHFRLAKLLNSKGDPDTRRHVLQALEEAPRYREALQLLLQLGPSPEAKEASESNSR